MNRIETVQPGRGPRARLAILYGSVLLLLAALLSFSEPPVQSLIGTALYDFRYLFIFSFAGLTVLELTALLGRGVIRRRSLYYLIAAVAVAGMAYGQQLLEPTHGSSEPDWGLATRNFIGALAVLTLSAGLDRSLRREHGWLRGSPRKIITGASIAVLLFILRPLIPVGLAYAGRDGAFPVLVDLTASWQRPFLELQDSELYTGVPPAEWVEAPQDEVAMLMFRPGAGGSVVVNEPYRDWRDYGEFRLPVFVDGPRPVTLDLRFEDKRTPDHEQDRYRGQFILEPGAHVVTVPFTEYHQGPAERPLRIARMRRIVISASGPPELFRIFVGRMRLAGTQPED
jgi:hypothetical protein